MSEKDISGEPNGDDWPKPDPEKEIINFMAGGDVALRVSEGPASAKGLPTDIFSELVDKAGKAIEEVGSMIKPPRLVGAYSGKSMVLVFGDALDDSTQPQLLEDQVLRSGQNIARMLSADGDELFSVAYGVGRGASAYADLIHLAETYALTMEWKAGTEPVQRIDPARAARQYERLTRQPATLERDLRIEGVLYRAIMERPGYGTAGMKLVTSSPLPPRHKGNNVVVRYESRSIEQKILHDLLGQMVVATVKIVEVDPESPSIIRPKLPHALVAQIEPSERPVTPELFGEDDTA